MKAVVSAFNQEKALVGAFSVITNLRMELFEALLHTQTAVCRACVVDIVLPVYYVTEANILKHLDIVQFVTLWHAFVL